MLIENVWPFIKTDLSDNGMQNSSQDLSEAIKTAVINVKLKENTKLNIRKGKSIEYEGTHIRTSNSKIIYSVIVILY